ncbi:rod shape-determining protein RodA [Neomegalonema perideroedes]|uniref:rod shape-determining protein RodA n=1 Tax=Neomegalonema perideroedes TaxID=217219 RepID=UPI00037ABFF0|nr:rod shape-determining protein RodA [Neomegalonema perideroedes]
MSFFDEAPRQRLSLPARFLRLHWPLIALIAAVATVGFFMMHSVGRGQAPWAQQQMTRFIVGGGLMVAIALVDVRFWRKIAYLAYAAGVAGLVAVDVMGVVGMGAQRWIDFGFVRFQPSELMKVALVLALARYYHDIGPVRAGKLLWLIPALLMIAAPCALVLIQPDLGTAVLLGLGGFSAMFLAGASWWFFILMALGLGGAIWAVFASQGTDWQLLRDYQYRRIEVFLDPTQDPQGAGYHINQSMIAFGSGGVEGKGYMAGSQTQLDFLPEKRTDFIFTTFAEEFGMIGAVSLLALYTLLVWMCLASALRIRHSFGRILAGSLAMAFFCYYGINMAMVMGLAPVVGVPLPLISYGGTSMIALMCAFGLMLSAFVYRDAPFDTRRG